MSGSAEEADERDRAKSCGSRLAPLEDQDSEHASSRKEEESIAAADCIRRIAASLDLDNLNEEELIALSDAALRLADVAKTQNVRKRDIASLVTQVDDWETRHAEAIAGTKMVTRALAVLRERIDAGEMDREDVSATLDLAERWLSEDARYEATHEKLKQAARDPDFELVRSLNKTLESVATELSQARAALDEASKPRPGDSTSDKPVSDHAEPSEPDTTERTDSLEEPTDQPAPSASVPSEGAPESTADEPTAASDEGKDGQRGAEPDSPIPPDHGKVSAKGADDPSRLADDDEGLVPEIQDAIAMSIEHGRLGLAYHLSQSVPDALPSASAIKLAAYNYVTDGGAPITAELAELAAALLQEAETVADAGPGWRSHVLFTTCAALAPALTAPGGPVAQLLAFFEPRLDDTPSLRALAKTAAAVSMTGVHLPIDLLREEDSAAKWRARESALRNETRSWIENERQSKIKYQAATTVWRRMLDDWERSNGHSSLGRIFSLLDEPIANIDAESVESVARISEYWRANGDKEIDRIDRENRSWRPTNKIKGSARLSLRNKVHQALALSDRWLNLIAERPDKVLPFHKEQARVLRTTVHNKVDLALAEMDSGSMPQVEGAQKLLRRYAALFNGPEDGMDGRPVGLADLLNGDLLAHPDILFDDTGQPADYPVDSDVLLSLLKRGTPDFGEAAVERAKRGDFLGAEAVVAVAERTGRIDDVSADRSRAVIENEREHIQSKLRERINETSNRLDAAYAAGVLTLGTYDLRRDRIPLGDFSETDTFGPLFMTLENIDKEIADADAVRRDTIRGSLAKLDDPSPKDRERIESAINSGRVQVAQDFIERIESGQGLPTLETTVGRPFDRFFPDFVESYTALRDREGDGIVHAQKVVVSRGSDAFIDATELSEDASRDGIDLLNAWVTLRDGQTTLGGLVALMRALGFVHPKVQRTNEETLDDEGVFALHAVPVVDCSVVQLPDFGSRADGEYRVFAVRRRTSGEAIIREVGRRNGAGRPPNIALFFGILDVDARRSLARDFHTEECHPTIVLDESLLAFLAAWSGDRLGAFFDCVSAFTSSQPYEPDAAELPPEMFFGRTVARRAILAMSHDMTHFVYGGRRLGKTTLLADIAREYRARGPEEPEELVLLINLKGSGIGENRPTEDLWPHFAQKLAPHEVVGARMSRAESVGKRIKQWLAKKQGRRVLLLVDEADAFLAAECRPRQGYRVLEQVKRLMEETKRRFKVVFAGLHNVQRAGRDPNTPFAHLGEAIRIGPMLPEIDGDEIQNLIRGPLEALGYRFVSNDSIIRIAAETNYYPALAQQFCKELLKTLREESYALSEVGPPYPIRPVLIDRVFNARETRDRIRNLFSWTIQLDLRYEFLTYLIAQTSFDNEDGRPQAMPITAIRDRALSEWPEGFASDSSFWTFEVLLEEMIGLGILRKAANREYAIRTRNLRTLLGNDDEIERRFSDAKNRSAPPIFERARFRSTLEGDTLSSLTAHQETRLLSGRHAVGLVFGTRLAGLHRVGDSLRRAAAKWDDSLFITEVSPTSLRPATRRALGSRKPGIHVVLVDMCGAWDVEILARALAFVGKHNWQERIVRPVFLCGPEDAWKWSNETVPTHGRVELRDIWLGPCGRDFTRIWLKDQESRAYADLEKPQQEVDHPWPLVVETAAGNKQLESIDEAITVTLDDDKHDRHVADTIGISKNADTALRLLATFPGDSMTADFLSELSEDEGTDMSPEEVIEVFNWASRLGVVCKDRNGYRLDSTYAEGLTRAFRK